jgi:hypothetical protein
MIETIVESFIGGGHYVTMSGDCLQEATIPFILSAGAL